MLKAYYDLQNLSRTQGKKVWEKSTKFSDKSQTPRLLNVKFDLKKNITGFIA